MLDSPAAFQIPVPDHQGEEFDKALPGQLAVRIKNLPVELREAVLALWQNYVSLDLQFNTTPSKAANDFLAMLPVIDGYEDQLRQFATDLVADVRAVFGAVDKPLSLRLINQAADDRISPILPDSGAHLIVVPVSADNSIHATPRNNAEVRDVDFVAGTITDRFLLVADTNFAGENNDQAEELQPPELSNEEIAIYERAIKLMNIRALNQAMGDASQNMEAQTALIGISKAMQGFSAKLGGYTAKRQAPEDKKDPIASLNSIREATTIRGDAQTLGAQIKSQIGNPAISTEARQMLRTGLQQLMTAPAEKNAMQAKTTIVPRADKGEIAATPLAMQAGQAKPTAPIAAVVPAASVTAIVNAPTAATPSGIAPAAATSLSAAKSAPNSTPNPTAISSLGAATVVANIPANTPIGNIQATPAAAQSVQPTAPLASTTQAAATGIPSTTVQSSGPMATGHAPTQASATSAIATQFTSVMSATTAAAAPTTLPPAAAKTTTAVSVTANATQTNAPTTAATVVPIATAQASAAQAISTATTASPAAQGTTQMATAHASALQTIAIPAVQGAVHAASVQAKAPQTATVQIVVTAHASPATTAAIVPHIATVTPAPSTPLNTTLTTAAPAMPAAVTNNTISQPVSTFQPAVTHNTAAIPTAAAHVAPSNAQGFTQPASQQQIPSEQTPAKAVAPSPQPTPVTTYHQTAPAPAVTAEQSSAHASPAVTARIPATSASTESSTPISSTQNVNAKPALIQPVADKSLKTVTASLAATTTTHIEGAIKTTSVEKQPTTVAPVQSDKPVTPTVQETRQQPPVQPDAVIKDETVKPDKVENKIVQFVEATPEIKVAPDAAKTAAVNKAQEDTNELLKKFNEAGEKTCCPNKVCGTPGCPAVQAMARMWDPAPQ